MNNRGLQIHCARAEPTDKKKKKNNTKTLANVMCTVFAFR